MIFRWSHAARALFVLLLRKVFFTEYVKFAYIIIEQIQIQCARVARDLLKLQWCQVGGGWGRGLNINMVHVYQWFMFTVFMGSLVYCQVARFSV